MPYCAIYDSKLCVDATPNIIITRDLPLEVSGATGGVYLGTAIGFTIAAHLDGATALARKISNRCNWFVAPSASTSYQLQFRPDAGFGADYWYEEIYFYCNRLAGTPSNGYVKRTHNGRLVLSDWTIDMQAWCLANLDSNAANYSSFPTDVVVHIPAP